MKKPRFITGALVGALLAGPLMVVLFLVGQALGLPFAPFALFDWLARVLPGAVVTFGIEAIVAFVLALGLGELSEVSKIVEQVLALLLFVLVAAALGAALFALWRARGGESGYPGGILAGAVAGGVVAIIANAVPDAGEGSPFVVVLLFVLMFGLWGAALVWAYRRLLAAASTEADAAQPAAVERLDRRRFLIRLGSASAVITVAGGALATLLRSEGGGRLADGAPPDVPAGTPAGELWSQRNPLPNSGAPVGHVPGTRPEYTVPSEHYRIDINLRPPTVGAEEWRLRTGGLVEAPREFTLEQLRSYEPMHQFITMSCISNPVGGNLISTTRWTGISMQRLLPDLGLAPGATHLRISSVDGFFEIISLETIEADERVMLAYEWDGVPLRTENGFPLRIYIPDVYGMKQPKWITRIEATDEWEQGYWVERGWDERARMRSTSVIDTVATDLIESRDGHAVIPVGGIAHAGARGISRVQVRVDNGEWQDALLREPISDLTWVIWRYDWPFESGQHIFWVRCFDGNGTPQIVERSTPHPSGATGLHRETVRL